MDAFQVVARHHNDAGITRPVPADVTLFHRRPFRVLGSHRFVEACLDRVSGEWLRNLPLTGGVDQAVDSTDALECPGYGRRLFG